MERTVVKEKLDTFTEEFRAALNLAVLMYPQEYAYPLSEIPAIVERMRVAFDRGSYNYDSRAIRITCKVLGIKPTRKAIEAYLTTPKGV